MGDKYKLIKEFPGSCELGKVIDLDEVFGRMTYNYTGYPEYWEKVVAKSYEILSYKYNDFIYTYEPSPNIFSIPGSRCYCCGSRVINDASMTQLSSIPAIYSIKRLCDGEIFTIGEKLNSESKKFVIITKITLSENAGYIRIWGDFMSGIDSWIYLDNISRLKEPLFVTEDGCDIFGETELFTVGFTSKVDYGDLYKSVKVNVKFISKPNHEDYKWFKSKDKADLWCKENEPKYSNKDMISFAGYSRGMSPLETDFECYKAWYNSCYNLKK